MLGQAGYFTAMSGKWHLGSARPHWPIDRGFQRMFSSPNGGGYYFVPFETANRPLYLNETLVTPGANFYSTDAFTDYGLQFIDEARAASKPFFLYLAYIAPHDPIEAYKADVDKYLAAGTYANGWAPVRAARFARQTAPGGIAAGLAGAPGAWTLSPAHNNAATWSSLSVSEKAAAQQRMAIYAGVVDRMDQQIGRVLAKFGDPNGDGDTADSIADNTIVIFLSDNGGGATGNGATGHPNYGNTSSGVSYGLSWANASNTPFRRFKASNQEGGIQTPLVIRWPAGITRPGGSVEAARSRRRAGISSI